MTILNHILRHVKTITGLSLPTQTVDVAKISENSQFLDKFSQLSYTNGQPMLLIGQDNWPVLLTRKVSYQNWNGPVASKTLLGWVIHGNVSKLTPTDDKILHVYESHMHEKDDLNCLQDLVKLQWKLETENTNRDFEISKDDKRCLEFMDNTLRRSNRDRFEC